MDTKQIIIPFQTVGQASQYGEENYGSQIYSCQDGDIACTTASNNGGDTGNGSGNGNTSTTAPNTGFLGMSQESAVLALGGGVVLLIALVLAVVFVTGKSRRHKQSAKEQ